MPSTAAAFEEHAAAVDCLLHAYSRRPHLFRVGTPCCEFLREGVPELEVEALRRVWRVAAGAGAEAWLTDDGAAVRQQFNPKRVLRCTPVLRRRMLAFPALPEASPFTEWQDDSPEQLRARVGHLLIEWTRAGEGWQLCLSCSPLSVLHQGTRPPDENQYTVKIVVTDSVFQQKCVR
jgi:hypothetical protein